MQGKDRTNQERVTFIHGDRVTCLALTGVLLAACVFAAVASALAAPLVNELVGNLAPQATPTISRAEVGRNLALRKPVRVSRALSDFPASAAVDGDPRSWWGSGSHAPEWIEVDLGGQYVVSEIRLLPSQSPTGKTIHRVLAKGTATDGKYLLIHIFDQPTSDNTWLTYALPQPLRGVRYLRVETVSSPSWVSWREIVVAAGK